MKANGKVFLVTGGGQGMGRELVLNLLSRGAKVIALDVNPNALQGTVDAAGSLKYNLQTVVADITNRELIESLRDDIITRFGTLDGIVNNAGIIQHFTRLTDTSYQEVERVMNINFYGTLYLVKAFLPFLLRRPEGHIVNVSSMGAFLPVPGQLMYGASKAAVRMMSEGLMSELVDTNVHVSVVFPGAIQTDIKKNSGLADDGENAENTKRKLTLPAEAAETIINGMEHNKKRILIGGDCKTMYQLNRISPDTAAGMIVKSMRGRHGL